MFITSHLIEQWNKVFVYGADELQRHTLVPLISSQEKQPMYNLYLRYPGNDFSY